MVCKQNKRSFCDDEPACQMSCKHLRQMEYGGHYSSFADIFPCHDFGGKVHCSGEEVVHKVDCEGAQMGLNSELTGSSSVVSSTTNEKRALLESALCLPCSDANPEHDHMGKKIQEEDLYSSFFEFPPRKPVLIGPDHQADVPVWDRQMCFSGSTTEDEERIMGTCVISLPSFNLPSPIYDEIGKGKVDCGCPDEWSIRCVRQHVMEAKEKIRAEVGQDKFLQLGFGDMGEVVSSKWSEVEEQLFHEVVYSNPVSMARNFWDHLLDLFPCKTTKDLVSYYFNVFMLRKRADQNRLYPLHVDSDNDEWQGSEDGHGDECGSIGDDEDSAVESPVNQAAFLYSDLTRYEDEYGIEGDSSEDIEEGNGDGDNSQELVHFGKSVSQGGQIRSPNVHLEFNNVDVHVSEDQDVQDESCTSYESQLTVTPSFGQSAMDARQEPCIEVHQKNTRQDGCCNSRLGAALSDGFAMEPCDSNGWDAGYFSGPTKEVDFLPTCHVIEEVFGGRNSDVKDLEQGFSGARF